jgi:uncharacterized membrane protein YcaP (DUF421 family)
MFFRTWTDLGHVVVESAVAFLAIVAILRVVGQQALAKMSGFDMVSTVMQGSIVATVAVSRDVTVSEGIAALVTIIAIQEVIRWGQARFLPVHHLVREAPHVVLWDGHLLEDRLLAISVSADEIRAAVRRAGFRSLSDVRLVVLENDGEWSVIAKSDEPSDESAFHGLHGMGDDASSHRTSSPRRIP